VPAVVVVLSGSVALLGDTLHNVAGALTAVPLLVAFVLVRPAEPAADVRLPRRAWRPGERR
jgi:divalent metal cation (Fe/Co/Zn/Cd) transporter